MKSKNIKSNSVYLMSIILGLLCIWYVAIFLIHDNEKKKKSENSDSFEKAAFIFEEKLNSYVFGLQGIAGIVRVKNFNPTPRELRDYAESRDNFTNFAGSLGFGFIRKIKRNDLDKYIKQQSIINPDLAFRQLVDKNLEYLFVIEHIYPLETNRAAVGLDVASEPVRREGVRRAIESGKAVITKEIQLVQAKKKEPGYLVYLPVYKAIKAPLVISDRHEDLVGLAYTPVLASNVVNSIKSRSDLNLKLNIQLKGSDDFLLKEFSELSKASEFMKVIRILEHDWILHASFGNEELFQIRNLIIIIGLIFSGLHIYFVMSFKKVIYQKETVENKANEIEIRLNNILNNITLGVISTDINGLIKTVNKEAEKIVGYTENELVNKETPLIFISKEELFQKAKDISMELDRDVSVGLDVLTANPKCGKKESREWTYLRKDSSVMPIRQIVTGLYNDENLIDGYIFIFENITDRKKLEQIVNEQRLLMIESSKLSSLGEMAGGVAHEINNPLAIISAKVSYLIRKISRNEVDLDFIKEDLQKVDHTVQRISKIVIGLRSLSRDSASDSMEDVLLEKVIMDSMSLCTERFKNHNIELKVDICEDIHILARGTQISQVILNLLNNSHDAIVENIETKWVSIKCDVENDIVKIYVSDSGPGIPPEIAAKIMDPFYTTKKVGKGTGLGLSISKSIINAHNGKMWYDPKSENTCFVIELPVIKGNKT